ncbi:hypothetical protein LTR66_017965, partial [Elasticomyces elasticus]
MSETCTVCSKPSTSLPQGLKRCAKCHTQSYCSRECQKKAWSVHKKECSKLAAAASKLIPPPPAAPEKGSLDNPPREEIIEGAQQICDLMAELSREPDFLVVLRDMEVKNPASRGL